MQIKSDIQVFFFYANWRIVDYKINNNSFVQVEFNLDKLTITCGVPQGLTLGPVQFLL